MSPWQILLGHITLVLWSIRRGEPGLGWVAVVAITRDSEEWGTGSREEAAVS